MGRSSEDKWELCGGIQNYNEGSLPVIVIPCSKYGDKVKITNDVNVLTLCEVEVLGKLFIICQVLGS